MCEGGVNQGVTVSYNIIMEVIDKNEQNPARKAKWKKEIDQFLGPGGSGTNFPVRGLDTKSRDEFQPLYN